MATPKVRVHREWFRKVSEGGRKSCPNCKAKLGPGESLWRWCEYRYAKLRNIQPAPFCRECFAESVAKPLAEHTGPCGCKVEMVGYQTRLPEWLALPEECHV